jgi:CRISPR/Cas system CMR-associated protein Cmr5 small subunit
MESREKGIEHKLTADIRETQKKYDDLMETIKEGQKRKLELEETLNGLKKTLEFYSSKSGKRNGDIVSITSEFANIESAREAIHIALQKYGDMDKQQLRDVLIKGGFNFRSKKPVPVIHLALVNDKKVTITEKGTYQWIGYSKSRAEILSLPKAIIKFFRERNNEPAIVDEILEGIIKMGVRTTSKDVKGNVESILMFSKDSKFNRSWDDKFSLKPDMFNIS